MAQFGYGIQVQIHSYEICYQDTFGLSMNSYFHLMVERFLVGVPTGQFLSGIGEKVSEIEDK